MSANTYGRQVVIPLTNKSGGGVIAGDVVIIDTSNNDAFTTTTSAATTNIVGVAQETIASNATGRVLIQGYAALVLTSASVTRGNYGTTHTVAKQAVDAGASRVAGAFCKFLTGGTTPDAVVYNPDLGGASLTNPMTTADDIIVGGASGTPARKAVGAAGAALSVINGALAYNSGTSFPSAVTGDRYWRTDRGLEYYYDGTRWLSTTLYALQFPEIEALDPRSVTDVKRAAIPHPTYDIWVVDYWAGVYIATTSSGTQYWTLAVNLSSGTTTLSTISSAANTLLLKTASVNALNTAASSAWIQIDITKVSTPGTLRSTPAISYRLVG